MLIRKMSSDMLLLIVSIYGIYIINYIPACCAKKKDINKSSLEVIEKEFVRFSQSGLTCKTVSVSKKVIYRLRIEQHHSQVAACAVSYLENHKEDGWAWSSLGFASESYLLSSNLRSSSVASTCFKQATKLDGKVLGHISEWHYLGPFVIGKSEVDGDPVEYYGGITHVAKRRNKKGEKFYSELAVDGIVKWSVYKQALPTSYVDISPQIHWNDLVSSLGSVGITEWQGWAVGEFLVNENNVNIVIQCLGVHTVYIDDIPVTGDVYRREQYWYAVNLNRGYHTVYIRLRAKVQQVFRCQIEQAHSNLEISKPHYIPDIWNGYLISNYIALPITNLQSSKWLKINRISIESQSEGEAVNANLCGSKPVSIAPGQTRPVIISLFADNPHVLSANCVSIDLKLKVTSSDGQLLYPISLRCRKKSESFIFTFLDHDGSVQHGAAIEPLQSCSEDICPILLTLHGTTVPAQNQADSYKHMVNGKFVFGADNAWVVAPTRHGAHNWEGPGALTALTATDRFCDIINRQDWLQHKASCDHIIFAGHSMGGHGAWHLATHYPDKALALVSLAGWIKKEEYGDSNLFFRHDIAISHVDPAVKAELEYCVAENEADRLVSNLQGIPVMTRVGANDRTISPYFVRRMYRILEENNVNVTYVEIPGKEHWWWDTLETNDGGCVNDKQLRDFTNQHSMMPVQSCDTEGQCSTTENTLTGISQPFSFTFTVINPAFGGSMRGIRVLQQIVPLKKSLVSVEVRHDVSEFEVTVLHTENIKLFSIHEPLIRSPNWSQRHIMVDKTTIWRDLHPPITYDNQLCLAKYEDEWLVSNECETPIGRVPGTLGPARTIAEQNFVIVTGTQGTEVVTRALQEFAVYIANLFFLTADTYAPIVKDIDLNQDKADNNNLIILGNSFENKYTAAALQKTDFLIGKDGKLALGSCTYDSAGLLTLAPHSNGRLALILQGSDAVMMREVVTLATPTIPPMTRSPFSNMVPDFVVIGQEYKAKGPGGYPCTGRFDNEWKLRRHLVSCSHCL